MSMKDFLLIIGAGGLGRTTLDIVSTKYKCFFVDDGYTPGDSVCGTIVIGTTSEISTLSKKYHNFII